tara:strand:- start:921 stop:2342 length:1422 start_codon:yes stop_codon:yes gene_type:complete
LKRTKIIATLGPASTKPSIIKKMINSGVDVFRLNMSHFHEKNDVKEYINILRSVSKELDKNIGILMDIAGPKIRVIACKDEGFRIKKGDILTIGYKNSDVKININPSFKSIDSSSAIKIDDGKLSFKVCEKIDNYHLKVKSLSSGTIFNGNGVNFPKVEFRLPALTDKDKRDVLLGLNLDIDWFALSFVRSSTDIEPILKILKSKNVKKPIIAKIEKPEAVDNLEDIISVFDGVLVARGDLGVEMGFDKVPIIQNRIVRLAHKHGKPIILATQMLDSMIYNSIPTRAEVSDVAISVEQSCDAVMLTAETSVGKFPVEAVKMMSSVICNMEEEFNQYSSFKGVNPIINKMNVQTSVCHSACNVSNELDIGLIVAMTDSGSSAISISSFRPKTRIIAMSPNQSVCKKLTMVWGIKSVFMKEYKNSDTMIKSINRYLVKNKVLKQNQYYIIVAGMPVGISGTTNLIRVEKADCGKK